MEFGAREISRIAGLLFFAALFVQSSLDKILDLDGNLKYVQSVFERTFLAPVSTPLFYCLTVLETLSGLGCIAGIVFLLRGNPTPGLAALTLVLICLISLFAGLRIAKDYAGAAALASYAAVALISLFAFR